MQIVLRTAPRRRSIRDIPIEAEEYEQKPVTKTIATFDTETDPFADERIVAPFTCGFYIPSIDFYIDFWGDDCIDQFFRWLAKVTAKGGEFEGTDFVILVHNGGNFDFYFMVDYFDSGHKPFIINGRLVRVMMQGQEFRDSYAMIPVALAEYEKVKFDYTKMEREVRHIHKQEIRDYLKSDCVNLATLVTEWLEMFGNRLTMASVALPQLRSFHGFETLHEKLDTELRPYYFGGRNQCFSTGVHHGDFKVYYINSSYPNVMRKYLHPISDTPVYETRITDKTHFAHIKAWSLGALPVRKADGGLDFPIGTFDFYACIHEINAGIATGTLRILKVYCSMYFRETSNFAEFVDTFYALRMDANQRKDDVKKLFYKLVLNSSYGKFAQDPRKYENWLFDPPEIPQPVFCEDCYNGIRNGEPRASCVACETGQTSPFGWYLHTTRDDRAIYASPQRLRQSSFYNVATAASITSAARAELLYGIKAAIRPLYCDTDSIICEGFSASGETIRLHRTDLGAWDIEAEGDTVCIAGKKLYAIFNNGAEVKKASKGVKLTAEEIRRVCDGEIIEYANPVPKFHLDGTADFITRTIRRTG